MVSDHKYQQTSKISLGIPNLVLFINPGLLSRSPGGEFFRLEPEVDFLVGSFDGVRTVDDVSADIDAVVTSDGARSRVEGSSFTEHLSASSDGISTFPDHGNNGAGSDVLDEATEEGLGGEVSIVGFEGFLLGGDLLKTDKLEALIFESLDDSTDETSLDTIGLDHDVGSFSLSSFHGRIWVYLCFKRKLIFCIFRVLRAIYMCKESNVKYIIR